MTNSERIERINCVLSEYFSKHKGETVKAKDMMPLFIEAGIFEADRKGGLPIRQILRDLDKENRLDRIPYVHAERKSVNTNWHFTDISSEAKGSFITAIKSYVKVHTANKRTAKRERDEDYVINLCDEILGLKAERQHTFDFLLGDTGRKLPVDAFYPTLNLVVEYREKQHTESVKFWNKLTASGISRDEQRARYDERRRLVLPEHGIRLVEISYSDLEHNSSKRLLRNFENDKVVIEKLLKK